MNVIGVPCPICGQKFTAEDDIVVCPDCGTPYHRSCYKEVGHCIMNDLHESGSEWVNPLEAARETAIRAVQQETILPCPACGHPNHRDNLRCENCGYRLKHADPAPHNEYGAPQGYENNQQDKNEDPYEDVFGPINPKQKLNSILIGDLMGFVQKNCAYFVRLFKLRSADRSAVVFNWSALFFGPFYFFYRKMHRKGFSILFLELMSYLPSFVWVYRMMPQVLSNPDVMQAIMDGTALASSQLNMTSSGPLLYLVNLCSYIPLILHIYCGFTANGSYYEHTMSLMNKLQKNYGHDRTLLEKQVLRAGGVSPLAVFLSMVGTGVAFLAVSFVMVMMLLPLV